MSSIIITIGVLTVIGIIGALCLWIVSKKFQVKENPLVEQIRALLPGANCGGCGLRGCDDLARTYVEKGSMDGLYCTSATEADNAAIASMLGCKLEAREPMVAVVKCNGSCEKRPQFYLYDGAKSCAIMSAAGANGCPYGCMGCGDCVSACQFGAITIDKSTGLPVVNQDLCTACGACVKACPRNIIELRARGKRDRRVWVACSSHDRGPVARKLCAVACIGCKKCLNVCPFGAINVTDNLSYIDWKICKTCGKCVDVCPTGAILTANMPVIPKNSVTSEK